MPRHHFRLGIDAVAGHELNVLRKNVGREGLGGVVQVGKAAPLRLRDPALVVAVAAEQNALMLGKDALDQLVERGREVLRALQLLRELLKLFGHDRVEDGVRAGDGLAGAEASEFELVAGEGDRGGAVAVGRILGNGRQDVHADAQALALAVGVVVIVHDAVYDRLQLLAEEYRNDRGRRLLCAETMVVSGKCDRAAQQLLILVHALDEGREEEQEARVLAGRAARREEVVSGVGGKRPVVVLAAAVDACEGLFMEQADQAVLFRDLLHDLHGKLILVVGGVCVGVDGGHLML